MKRLVAVVFTILCLYAGNQLFAQGTYKQLKDVPSSRSWIVNFSDGEGELSITALKQESVAPEVGMTSSAVKAELDAKRKRKNTVKHKTSPYSSSSTDINPQIDVNFNGRPLGLRGIPNDNTMAISNGGKIVSAINSIVSMLDSDGTLLRTRSLSAITKGQLGFLDRCYDPKVLYDPIADRFILVFLQGSTSADTRIIVGFSLSNDPTEDWKFYQIDGKPLGGTTWSDYPIIAHNKEDLYITVNLLRDNESWQEGFVQSFIWQINKQDGYDGEELTQNLFYDIEFNNKALWSICPVQPANDFEQTKMYFLSVRPGTASNDSVFLHTIDNTSKSGIAEHHLDVFTTGLDYGVPPSAFQPEVGFRLQTNDTRVLSATNYNGDIHYVQSTLIPEQLSSGIYHGVIKDVEGNTTVSATYISDANLDLAYPSISFSGVENESLNSMLITFSHSGENDYPGTSVIFHNSLGGLNSLYSEIMPVKNGEDLINFI